MTSEEHLSTIEEQIMKEEQKSLDLKEWDARMELALFNAISRCKPVGNCMLCSNRHGKY